MGAITSSHTSVDPSREMSRRGALRSIGGGLAVAAAGIAASTAVDPSVTAAQSAACSFDRASYDLAVKDIELGAVHDFVAKLVDAGGCPACGFLGIDLRLRGSDPRPDPWLFDHPIFSLTPESLPGVTDLAKLPQDPIPLKEGVWGSTVLGLSLAVDKSITLDQIHDTLAKLVDAGGCSACGFLGIDLRILAAGPQPDPWTTESAVFQINPADLQGVSDHGVAAISDLAGFQQ